MQTKWMNQNDEYNKLKKFPPNNIQNNIMDGVYYTLHDITQEALFLSNYIERLRNMSKERQKVNYEKYWRRKFNVLNDRFDNELPKLIETIKDDDIHGMNLLTNLQIQMDSLTKNARLFLHSYLRDALDELIKNDLK